jgi:periplasmic protein TonB
MRYFQPALICFICVSQSYSQVATRRYGQMVVEIIKEKNPKRIIINVEVDSSFTRQDSSWVDSLEINLIKLIKVKKRLKRGKYIVSVKFLLEKDGSMTDIRCLNDPGLGLCEQIRTAIVRTFPWKPPLTPAKVRPYHTSSTKPQEQ